MPSHLTQGTQISTKHKNVVPFILNMFSSVSHVLNNFRVHSINILRIIPCMKTCCVKYNNLHKNNNSLFVKEP